jgi:Flp pilus assembly protein CpaB
MVFIQAMGDEMGDQQTQYVNAANGMSVVTLEMGDNQVAWTAQDDAAANDDSRDDQSEKWAAAQAASTVEVSLRNRMEKKKKKQKTKKHGFLEICLAFW